MNINTLPMDEEYKLSLKRLNALGKVNKRILEDLIDVFSLDITDIDRDLVIDVLINLINERELKKLYFEYIENLKKSGKDVRDYIDAYEFILSDKFSLGLNFLDISSVILKNIKDELKNAIKNSNELNELSFNIYKAFWNIIKMNRSKQNTRLPLYTEKNVLSTEAISELHIRSMDRFLEIFENITYFHKDSASDSIILTANLKNSIDVNSVKRQNVLSPKKLFYMKVFPNSPKIKQLQTELKIYDQLFKLVEHNVTPNILCKSFTQSFDESDDFDKLISSLIDKEYTDSSGRLIDTQAIVLKSKKKINKRIGLDEYEDWEDFSMIMTHAGGPTLQDVFKSLSPLELKHVMFQIIYTLYIFDKLEISHGDLHAGNIFVITLDKPRVFCYKIGTGADTRYYKFTSNKLVKIYDFDHGIICKKTTFNATPYLAITIDNIKNPIREPGKWANESYAETSIFNNKLDVTILFIWGLIRKFSLHSKDKFNISSSDTEFNDFVKDIFSGFSGKSTYSTFTIEQTYDELANPDLIATTIPLTKEYREKNLRELNRIMDVRLDEELDLYGYEIDETEIFNKEWKEYFEDILFDFYGRIIKNVDDVKNNHLWIPNEIILDIPSIIKHSYFDSLLVSNVDLIDSSKYPIFNIDDKL